MIGSDNGLAPIRRQAIIWTNATIFPMRHISIKFIWNSKVLIKKNAFEYVVCKMAAIVSWPQWVNKENDDKA